MNTLKSQVLRKPALFVLCFALFNTIAAYTYHLSLVGATVTNSGGAITVDRGFGTGSATLDVTFTEAGDGMLTLNLPSGVTYVAGSAMGFPEADISDPGAPEFAIPAGTTAGSTQSFSFEVEAGCAATSGTPTIGVVVTNGGVTSNDNIGITVRSAILNIANPGGAISYDRGGMADDVITVTNGGNGSLDGFQLTIDEDNTNFGETASITIGGTVITPSSAAGADPTVFNIPSSVLSGGTFDNGESLSITLNKVFAECGTGGAGTTFNNFTNTFEASFGDGSGAVCESAQVTGNYTFNAASNGDPIPSVAQTVTQAATGCQNAVQTFTLTNDAAPGTPFANGLNVSLRGDNLDGMNQVINWPTDIIVAGSPVLSGTTTAITGTGGGIGGDFSSLMLSVEDLFTTDPDGAGTGLEDLDGDLFFDDLAPGESVSFDVEYTYPNTSLCTITDATTETNIRAIGELENICGGTPINNVGNTILSNDPQGGSAVLTGLSAPAEVGNGQTGTIQAQADLSYAATDLVACPTATFILSIPDIAGVTITAVRQGNTALVTMAGTGTTEATLMGTDGGIIEIDFTTTQGTTPDPFTFEYNIDFVCDDSCPEGRRQVDCEMTSAPISVPAPPACSGGPQISGTLIERQTPGFTDRFATTRADLSTVSPVSRKRVLPCDSFLLESTATIVDGPDFTDGNNLYYRVAYNLLNGADRLLDYREGTFTTNGGTPAALPAPVFEMDANGQHVLIYDLGPVTVGDVVDIDLGGSALGPEALTNDLQQFVDFTNNFFTQPGGGTVDASTMGTSCGTQALEFYIRDPQFSFGPELVGESRPVACRTRPIGARSSRLFFRGNEDGSDIASSFDGNGPAVDYFPGEVRPILTIDSIVITFPPELEYEESAGNSQDRLFYYGPRDDGYPNAGNPNFVGQAFFDLPDPSINGMRVTFENPGDWPVADDWVRGGFWTQFSYRPDCEAAQGSYDIRIDYHVKEYANGVADCVGDIVVGNDITISLTPPNINANITSAATVVGDSPTECFEVSINPGGIGTPMLPNGYIGFPGGGLPSGDFSIESVTDEAGTVFPVMTSASGQWVDLGPDNLNRGGPIQPEERFTICASYSSCAPVQVPMDFSYDCDAPVTAADDPAIVTCNALNANVTGTINPADATIQASFEAQPTPPSPLCEDLVYDFRIQSSNTSDVVDPFVEVVLPEGLTPNMLEIRYPETTGTFEDVTAAGVTSPGVGSAPDTLRLELGAATTVNDSIPGVNNSGGVAENRAALVRLTFVTDCDFPSGGVIDARAFGNAACGDPASGSGTQVLSDAISIDGAELPFFGTDVTIDVGADTIITCEDQTVAITLTLFDDNGTPGDAELDADLDSITFSIPDGIQLVTGSFMCSGANCPSAPVVSMGGAQAAFGLPDITIPAGGSVDIAFTVDINAVDDGVCGIPGALNVRTQRTVSDVPCATEMGGVCPNPIVSSTGGTDVLIVANRPSLSNLAVDLGRTGANSFNFDGTVDISDVDLPTGSELVVEAYCVTGGTPDAAPLATVPVMSSGAAGTMATFEGSFTGTCASDEIEFRIGTVAADGSISCVCNEVTARANACVIPTPVIVSEECNPANDMYTIVVGVASGTNTGTMYEVLVNGTPTGVTAAYDENASIMTPAGVAVTITAMDTDNESCVSEGVMTSALPSCGGPPPCDLTIANVDPSCSNGADFSLAFDVSYIFPDGVGEDIIITVDGMQQPAVTTTAATGTVSVGPITFTEPRNNLVVSAVFANRADCQATTTADLVACTPACTGAADEIGGNVFLDENFDGAATGADEEGIPNVFVQVYADDGSLICEVYTNADGDWSCTGITNGEEYRVEYSTPLNPFLVEGFAGPDSESSVQFITGGNCDADYGLVDAEYQCRDQVVILSLPCYEGGDYSGLNANNAAAVAFGTSASGDAASPSADATLGDIGATWGGAYNQRSSQLYFSSVLKRHSGFADGPGYIYQIDYSSGTSGVFVSGYDLDGVVPANRPGQPLDFGDVCRDAACATAPGNTGIADDYVLPSDPTDPSVDLDAFAKIGTISYGDIEYDYGTDLLWTVNLNERSLLSIADAGDGSPGEVNAYDILGMPGVPACPRGELRPWGLNFNEGLGYLGVVCDASTSQNTDDVVGYVLRFDPANPEAGFVVEVEVDMREFNRGDFTAQPTLTIEADMIPWVSSFDQYPADYVNKVNSMPNEKIILRVGQPILSDIGFTPDGDLIVGILDRTTFQVGADQYTPRSGSTQLTSAFNYGDIFYYCRGADGSYTKEGSNTGCVPPNLNDNGNNDTSQPALQNNDDIVFGAYNFGGDYFNLNGGDNSRDYAQGSFIVLPETGEIVYTVTDPFPPELTLPVDDITPFLQSQGVHWNSISTGDRVDWYQIVGESSADAQYFGKGTGLGDLVNICSDPRIQVGNYAWIDTNNDGIQQPEEEALANLPVSLFDDAGNLIATTVTDMDGNYYFSSASADGVNWVGTGADTALIANRDYTIVFGTDGMGTDVFDTATGTLLLNDSTYVITTNDTGEGPRPDSNDSDAVAGTVADYADFPSISFNTGSETSHVFDAGFAPACPFVDLVPDGPSVCVTASVELSVLVDSILLTNGFEYEWSTSGTGEFLDVAGVATTDYATAVTYNPSAADGAASSVTLTLSSTAATTTEFCETATDSVIVELLNVDCGEFFWDGGQ